MAAAARTGRNGTTPAADELDGIKAAVQAVARITANVAARHATVRWTDFRGLLRDQYSGTPGDIELFMDILAGRKP